MMTGACTAASIDSNKFRKMNGYGSRECFASTTPLIIAHATKNMPKPEMNPHEPPTAATLSASR